MVAELERLLDAPVVSQALGKKAVSIVSNLMEGDPLALDASSNRYNPPDYSPTFE